MDALDLVPVKEIQCLDKGFVKLIDVMPRIVPDGQTCDYAICQAARVSYGQGTKSVNEDKGLIRYLMRHSHTTPNEMIDFKFLMKMPLFIARQMFRHRTVSLNEISGRYSVMKDEFYIPDVEEKLFDGKRVSHISECLKGKRKSTHGYVFKYKD
jgi:thymidylate synthase (FAD)